MGGFVHSGPISAQNQGEDTDPSLTIAGWSDHPLGNNALNQSMTLWVERRSAAFPDTQLLAHPLEDLSLKVPPLATVQLLWGTKQAEHLTHPFVVAALWTGTAYHLVK